ncbi:hypothetical protein ONZ45_g13411 [Pleurotus djamor]|nr:hypothetical protein ONZ45_g13411 [Pleurotus djamor]
MPRIYNPRSTPPPPSLGGDRGPSDSNRPLNLRDALSYLDEIKVQRPDVYTRFLDIMMDFRTQAIDIPTVLDRVARLFHGNPQLIQGFNIFLPVSYRIEVSAGPSLATVTAPSDTMTQSTTSPPPHQLKDRQ